MTDEKFHIVTIAPKRLSGMFHELAETLLYGLRALGCEASMATNRFSEIATNIILGAGLIPEHMIRIVPGGSIFYNTEQIDSEEGWTRSVLPKLVSNFEAWDYSQRNVDCLSLQGIKASFVPIGYVPQLRRIRKAEEQDIDVLFYGCFNERRMKIIEQLRACSLSVCAVDDCHGYERDLLISRAKVVLNLHYYNTSNTFEIVRLSYLLANQKAVVAEIDEDTDMDPCYREAVAVAEYDQLARACVELVHDAPKRTELEERGFEIMSSLREEEYLGPILERRKRGR